MDLTLVLKVGPKLEDRVLKLGEVYLLSEITEMCEK